jgi:hypothetical protein
LAFVQTAEIDESGHSDGESCMVTVIKCLGIAEGNWGIDSDAALQQMRNKSTW